MIDTMDQTTTVIRRLFQPCRGMEVADSVTAATVMRYLSDAEAVGNTAFSTVDYPLAPEL